MAKLLPWRGAKRALLGVTVAVYLIGRPGGEPYKAPPPSPATQQVLADMRAQAERDARVERDAEAYTRLAAEMKREARAGITRNR